ncbi:MAG: PhoH family protein [Myxococcales bacterium]|nr:PhoH family protein [Myxococcales bacterium]MCB9709525.1 PhoH family protein [Myxococcales bacterium]
MTTRKTQPRSIHSVHVEVADTGSLLAITGSGNDHLKILENELGVAIGQRGTHLYVQGQRKPVDLANRVLTELLAIVQAGALLSEIEVLRVVRALKKNPATSFGQMLNDVVLAAPRGPITPKNLAQQQFVAAIRANSLVFGVGPAGTGKTYLAMAMAVRALSERRVKRIVLARPAVEAGEKLGFLPGDLAEKVNPYLRPLYDALYDMMDVEKAQGLIQREAIEVAPLAFMRGRTLSDSFVILDEAQNTTIDQMKMFLTRLGHGTNTVVTGDITQVDLPSGQPSGLIDAVALLRSVDDIGICLFSSHDVVRHPLVQKIIDKYDRRDSRPMK